MSRGMHWARSTRGCSACSAQPMTRPRFTVALTGGIASGKSAASDRFAALGADVVDADLVSRELVAPGGAALGEIVAAFGKNVLTPEGALDRRAMRALVFADGRSEEHTSELQTPCNIVCRLH